MKKLTVYLCFILGVTNMSHAETIAGYSFEKYPAKIYTGKKAPLKLGDWRSFRTRLTEAHKEGDVNFAGNYIVTTWGCGASCVSGAMIDKRTGNVYGIPLGETGCLTPLTEFEVPQPALPEYQALIEKISARLSHPWTLADIAHLLNISERTVSRQFTQQTGLSFIEWLRRLRLQHSLELLLQGQSVLDVALAVGYDSPSAFSTTFKQRIGLSPTQYVAGYQRNFTQV
jgi:AraC-like DNA-binding protein